MELQKKEGKLLKKTTGNIITVLFRMTARLLLGKTSALPLGGYNVYI